MKTVKYLAVGFIVFLLASALSMLITAGIIKLICICFSLEFSWPIAIGIWLIMFLLRTTFTNSSKE